MSNGRVAVGFLHPGHVSAVFHVSLLDLMFCDAVGAQRIMSHKHGNLAKQCGAAGIVDGRNKIAGIVCNESDVEWLLMVDSDMAFAPDTVERLIAAADPVERPIVGALCFAHKTQGKASLGGTRYVAQPTVYDFLELEDRVGFVPRWDYPRDELTAVAGTGAACLLIHRTVLERIQERDGPHWFTPVTHPKGPTTFSEDLSFCVRAAAVDAPVHVHTGIKTGHDKGGVFLDEAHYDRQQRLAEWEKPDEDEAA